MPALFLMQCIVCREGRVLGVLEVSRSIGDGRFKGCGVTCVPDVMRCTLTDNDRYNVTVFCGEGEWCSWNNNEALQSVTKCTYS